MSATITGVGSGFDIDSWVSQLVSAKESSLLTPLETKLSTGKSDAEAAIEKEATKIFSGDDRLTFKR